MKNRNLLLTVAVILGMISGLTAQNVPSYVPTNGLVGWWPFNGNANDESGNGNNGTVNGATLTTDRFGNAGKAFNFDGLNDYIEKNDLNISAVNGFSFSIWVYLKNTVNPGSQPKTFFYLVNQTFQGYNLGFDYSTLTVNLSSNANQISSGNNPYLNNWVNYSVVLNQFANQVSLFVNGNLVGQSFGAFPSPLLYLNIGRTGDGGDGWHMEGSLDDIAIWNRALSQSEITQLYNQGICKTSITVTDTLLIHTGITSYNPVAYQNTLKVWPNPGNQDITIDAGNLVSMQGWKIRVSNAQGVQIYPSGSQSGLVNQQQQTLDMSSWGGNGLYFLYLIDPQNNIQEVKKIVLAP